MLIANIIANTPCSSTMIFGKRDQASVGISLRIAPLLEGPFTVELTAPLSDVLLETMSSTPIPLFQTIARLMLLGTLVVYDSQAELLAGLPHQWREFRLRYPKLCSGAKFYGASPCTSDRKIHYFTGVAQQKPDDSIGVDRLTIEAGEYAVVRVNDSALLPDTWTWLLESWMPTSGRQEKRAPEFESYTDISEAGHRVGPVEIWIPLEPIATDASVPKMDEIK